VLVYLRDNQELIREPSRSSSPPWAHSPQHCHNIRNPLSAIAHAGQLLAEAEGLNADDRHLLDIIRRNSGRIDEIVSSVLQLSRRNRVEPQTVELVAWLDEFCEEFQESAGLRRVPDTGARTLADLGGGGSSHLHQIITTCATTRCCTRDGPTTRPASRSGSDAARARGRSRGGVR